MSNAGLSRREAVGFVPLVLPERSGGKGHRLSPASSLSEAKGESVIRQLQASSLVPVFQDSFRTLLESFHSVNTHKFIK